MKKKISIGFCELLRRLLCNLAGLFLFFRSLASLSDRGRRRPTLIPVAGFIKNAGGTQLMAKDDKLLITSFFPFGYHHLEFLRASYSDRPATITGGGVGHGGAGPRRGQAVVTEPGFPGDEAAAVFPPSGMTGSNSETRPAAMSGAGSRLRG